MADWARNILQVSTDTEKSVVDSFFSSIASKGEFEEEFDLLIDFQKIIPVASGDDEDWREARWEAWGTKGCYYFGQHRIDEYTIRFLTAWTGVPELMKELSRQNPEIRLKYICEFGYESDYAIGVFTFYGGEVLDYICHEIGTELYEKYDIDLSNDGAEVEDNDIDTNEVQEFVHLKDDLDLEDDDLDWFEDYESDFDEIVTSAYEDLMRIYQTPLEELNLTTRTYNCLKRANINTVGDITDRTEQELMQIRNFNEQCLVNILKNLEMFKLTLRCN